MTEHVDVRHFTYEMPNGTCDNVTVRAGVPTTVRVVPPAGERYAFTRSDYPVEVQVSVSPTGRSVQVYVQGEKVWPHPVVPATTVL